MPGARPARKIVRENDASSNQPRSGLARARLPVIVSAAARGRPEMQLVSRFKSLATKSRLVRHAVLQYRMRTGQPDWDHLVKTPAYRDRLAAARGGGRNVLVGTSMGGFLLATQMDSMLALALTARGANVHMLLCDGALPACHQALSQYLDEKSYSTDGPGALYCRGCFSTAYDRYRSLGVTVHRYSDFLTADDRRQARDVATSLPLEQIRGYRHHDIPVGDQAFAGAVRFFARGQLRSDDVSRRVLRRYLEASLLTSFVARRLFAEHRFDSAVFHHGMYVPQGVLSAVARQAEVRTVNWDVAYRKKCFIFSHRDTFHRTLSEEPTESWENIPWSEKLDQRVVGYLKSRWNGSNDWISYNRVPQDEIDGIMRELGSDPNKPSVALLTNVMWDARIHYRSVVFDDMLDWVLKTIAYFARRPDLQLFVRAHPAEVKSTIPSHQPIVDEIARAYPKLPPNVFVIPPGSPISTYAVAMHSNVALIHGTKMGVELAAMGLPVIVAGEAWVRNKGITEDMTSEEEYFRALDQLPRAERLSPEVVARARKFAFHFFFRRMIPIGFAEAPPKGGLAFPEMEVEQLSQGVDPGLDIICAGILEGRPFVYPAEND
jgi:hypothetical protein